MINAFMKKTMNVIVTWFAKRMAATGCMLGCHSPEAPEELFNK
ncbi:hypothetical protein [Paenibacillus elgii]|nr:hypothetical protein [Paenibacillus elgii]